MADPISLLPTVLEKLPTLHANPALAAGVLAAVREAAPAQHPQTFHIQLLPHLTAFALTAPQPLLVHAAHTVVALVRSLATRRAHLARLRHFVLHLVNLAKALLRARGPQPIPLNLPSFPIANAPNLPPGPASLNALLYLLALLVPAASDPPLPLPPTSAKPPPPDNPPSNAAESACAALRLWLSLGARVRTAVLDLAARSELLSAKCGPDAAAASLHILQTAFDPAAAIAPPSAFRQRLVHILAATIPHSPNAAALLRTIAQAQPAPYVPPHVVAAHAVPILLRDDAQSDTLRAHASAGLLDFRSSPVSAPLAIVADSATHAPLGEQPQQQQEEPARKRRRVNDGSSTPGIEAQRAMETPTDTQTPTQTEDSQVSAAASPLEQTARPSTPAQALRGAIESLHSVQLCAQNPASAHFLARAVHVVADALHSVRSYAPCHGLRDWLFLASVLSRVLRDTLQHLPPALPCAMRAPLHCAVHAVARVLAALHTLPDPPPDPDSARDPEPACPRQTVAAFREALLRALSALYTRDAGADAPVDAAALASAAAAVCSLACAHAALFDNLSHGLPGVRDAVTFCDAPATHEKKDPAFARAAFTLARAFPASVDLPDPARVLRAVADTEDPAVRAAGLNNLADCLAVVCRARTGAPANPDEALNTPPDAGTRRACADAALDALAAPDDRVVCAALAVLATLQIHAAEEDADACAVQAGLLRGVTHCSAAVRACATSCLLRCLREQTADAAARAAHCPCGLSTWADDPRSAPPPIAADCAVLAHGVARLLLRCARATRPDVCAGGAVDGGAIAEVGVLASALPFDLGDRLSAKVAAVALECMLAAASVEVKACEKPPSPHDPVPVTAAASRPHAFGCVLAVLDLLAAHVDTRAAHGVAHALPAGTVKAGLSLKGGQRGSANSLRLSFASVFGARMKDWMPLVLDLVLGEPAHAAVLQDLVGETNKRSFWAKISRHGAPSLIMRENASSLNALAVKLNVSAGQIVEDAAPEVFAQVVMGTGSVADAGPVALISELLNQDVDTVVGRKAGKLVQRLVMEFGGPLESVAKRSLMNFAKTLKVPKASAPSPELYAGSLVVAHFMLVMDAVSRRLFQSRAPLQQRVRVLRILEKVISLSTERLHIYVAKILATLKMSLDIFSENEQLFQQTMSVWTVFLKTLGTKRVSPHLASILSILVPFSTRLTPALGSTLQDIMKECYGSSRQSPNKSLLTLLVKLTDVQNAEKGIALPGANDGQGARGNDPASYRLSSASAVVTICRDVGVLISQHENGAIEVLATQYLLLVLRQNRNLLEQKAALMADYHTRGVGRQDSTVPRLSAMLVDYLHKTRTVKCQNTLLECIGELGAVDPVVIARYRDGSTKGRQHRSDPKIEMPLHVHGLVAKLLDKFLVPTLTHGEIHHTSGNRLNRIGLVIQELLKVCGCGRHTPEEAKNPSTTPNDNVDWDEVLIGRTDTENAVYFWENLQPSTRDVVQPYLAEPFDVRHYKDVFGEDAAGKVDVACAPVWSKVRALLKPPKIPTAQEWRRQAAVQLVDYIGVEGTFGRVLRALRPILRYEDNVTAYVFPLIFVSALDLGENANETRVKQFLIKEISELLGSAAFPEPIFDLFDVLRNWREERCAGKAEIALDDKFGRPGSSSTSVSSKRKASRPVFIEAEKGEDPLSLFVDFEGREDPSLSLLQQAKCAYRARAFTRAILYAESHIRNLRNKKGNPAWASFPDSLLGKVRTDDETDEEGVACAILQKCFGEVEDADSMKGIALMRSSSSLAETVLDTEVSGRFNEALITYERAISEAPRSETFHHGFMQCLMTLGHWETLLAHAEGLVTSATIEESSLRRTALTSGVDAAWRLGRWDALERLQESSEPNGRVEASEDDSAWTSEFAQCFGKMFLSIHKDETSAVQIHAKEARSCLRVPLVRAAREGYSRCYPLLISLHMITDVEESITPNHNAASAVIDLENEGQPQEAPSRRLVTLSSRTSLSAPSLRVREQLLSTRRVCFEQLGNHIEAAKVSLELARFSKENDNLRSASASAFRAMNMQCSDEDVKHRCALEAAEILKEQGDVLGALNAVKQETDRLFNLYNSTAKNPNTRGIRNNIANRLCSSHVLAGNLSEETRSEESSVVEEYFKEAAKCGPRREEPFYALGKHYDALLQASAASAVSAKPGESSGHVGVRSGRRGSSSSAASGGGGGGGSGEHHSRLVPNIINSFSRALSNGHAHIFEALPRMLTVWFDFYTELDDNRNLGWLVEPQVKKEVHAAINRIPTYMWMTATSQLTSRILHPHKTVKAELRGLLAKVITDYPDPCCWTILPSSQFTDPARKTVMTDILNQSALYLKGDKSKAARDRARLMRERLQTAVSVVRCLVKICLYTPSSSDKRGTRTENFEGEFRAFKNVVKGDGVTPILPTLDSLTVRLPIDNDDLHRPFAEEQPRIAGICDRAMVMGSLMSPRRISLVGSDGRQYFYLAKQESQGDMRKDSRFVEFLNVVNRLLSKDPTCSGKDLRLKTYAVLPLTEQTGMIEWVNDLTPFRMIVAGEHDKFGSLPGQRTIQMKRDSLGAKRWLTEWAFDKFPTVMDRFFVRRFGGGDAQAWLRARNEWTKSCAVWSMSGYIVGLGDRHGENVLVETTTGRCVHVDFAMLFEKGKTLRVPEIVPFRLTRNMVCAMGVSGYEGTFRCTSEVVMRIMRRNRDALLSVLESFLHDPLVDWGKRETGATGGTAAMREGWRTRGVVKDKLTGIVEKSGLPLSIEGQVGRVIREASSPNNLCQMYIWWGAWL